MTTKENRRRSSRSINERTRTQSDKVNKKTNAILPRSVAKNMSTLFPPKRRMVHTDYVAARQATALLVKEQNMQLVDNYFASGAVVSQRLLGVENAKPDDDFFYAIVRDGGPVPMQSAFRLGAFERFVEDGQVFRDAHAMVDALWLSWSYAADFFYIIATTINGATWEDICMIVVHGALPHSVTPMLLATCLHFARYLVPEGMLDVVETRFERVERRDEDRSRLMNVDWRVFTFSAIDRRYHGTEMKSAMRANFAQLFFKRTLAAMAELMKILRQLHYSKEVTLAMAKATLPNDSTVGLIMVDEAEIEAIYNRLQWERFDRVFYNRAQVAEPPAPTATPTTP